SHGSGLRLLLHDFPSAPARRSGFAIIHFLFAPPDVRQGLPSVSNQLTLLWITVRTSTIQFPIHREDERLVRSPISQVRGRSHSAVARSARAGAARQRRAGVRSRLWAGQFH